MLVVDDNPSNVPLLSADDRAGLQQIATETDARKVVAPLPAVKPDLVLLDLHMPDVHGLDRLARQSLCGRYYLPVLVLTADTTTERATGRSSWAPDFLTKPLDIVEIGLRIANLLETRQLYSMLRPSGGEPLASPIPNQNPGVNCELGAAADRIRAVLRDKNVVPFYQPVIDVSNLDMVGQEALAGFPIPHPQGPAGLVE